MSKDSLSAATRRPSRRAILKAAACATPLYAMGGATRLLSEEPPPAANLLNLGARAVVDRISKGELKAEAYMEQLLSHYNAHKDLNAIVTIDPARILEAARAVDKARSRGDRLGALAGLPFIVKDQIEVAGYPTTAGNALLKAYVSKKSATIVDRMTRGGAIVFAKGNLQDMVGGVRTGGVTSSNRSLGFVHNPYDPARVPGGSSGGNGAAIAARIVPAGLGEDTHGSVRLPSAFCGIAGLRPSTGGYKRYPDDGIIPPPGALETIGPMARTVADVAFLDSIITGVAPPAVKLSGTPIGIPRGDYWESENVDRELAKTMRSVFSRLRDEGAQLVELDLTELMQLNAGNVLDAAMPRPAVSFPQWLAANLPGVKPEQVYIAGGRGVSTDSAAAQPQTPRAADPGIVAAARHKYAEFFRENAIGALAMPTVPITAPLINKDGDVVGQKVPVNGKMVDEFDVIVSNLYLASELGAPALNIPAGLVGGLPVGLLIQQLPGEDSELLGLGIEIEKVLGPLAPPPFIRA